MKKIHYGWIVCLGCTLLMFSTAGLVINAFSVYQPYIMKLNGFSNTQSSVIVQVKTVTSFLALFLVGAYYRRFSMRMGMVIAGLMTAASFALYGLAHSFLAYTIASGLSGFGYGFGAIVGNAMLLAHWFEKKRTLAYGVSAASTGLSTLGITSLITWSIEQNGLGRTFLAEALVAAIIALLAGALIRNTPQEMNLQAYGHEEASESETEKRNPAKNSRPSLERKDWLLLGPAMVFLALPTNTAYAHLSVLFSSEGYSSGMIAGAITLIGITLIFSKLLYGWQADKLSADQSNLVFGSLLTIAGILCAFCGKSVIFVYLGVLVYGLGMPLSTVAMTHLASELADAEHFNDTVRRCQVIYTAGAMVCAVFPGVLADRFGGSYRPAFLLFSLSTVLMMIFIQILFRKGNSR